MRKLTFNAIHLLSRTERRGRTIKFHPSMNLIRGENSTGKSALIKSLFSAMGASPQKQSSRWKTAKVDSLLHFSFKGENYAILKSGNTFSLFKEDKTVIGSYRKITSELAPALAKLLGISLKLTNRQLEFEIPSPAFFYVPFYIDQDSGWTDPLCSFSNRYQYSNWKKSVLAYHTGERGDKWYKLNSEKISLEKTRIDPQLQVGALRALRKRVSLEMGEVPFDFDIKKFKVEIDNLLSQCDDLSKAQEKYRHTISDLENERIRLEAQVEIVLRAEKELAEDFDFANSKMEDHVECPTCGAEYENNFAERFSIARDEDRCTTLAQELESELTEVKTKAAKHRQSLVHTEEEIAKIERILNHKMGDVTLDDLLKRESRKQLSESVDEELRDTESELAKIDVALAILKKEIKSCDSKEKRDQIYSGFHSLYRNSLISLKVDELPEKAKSPSDLLPKGVGSDNPRAILSFYNSLVRTIETHGSSVLFPFVIDSPNQQEQDRKNLKGVLEYLKTHRPKDVQMFVGLVEDKETDFGGGVIDLGEEKYSLLREEEFSAVSSIFREYENSVANYELLGDFY